MNRAQAQEALDAFEELESQVATIKQVANNALAVGRAAREDASRMARVLTPSLAVLREVTDGQEVVSARLGTLFDLTVRQASATAQLAELVHSKRSEQAPAALAAPLAPVAAEPGPRGVTGPKGDAPAHEWVGTALRFEKPDGEWGDLVDLKGEPGAKGKGKGGGGRFDLSQLPTASDAPPDQFIVLQGSTWVRATYEQMVGWLGGAVPTGDALVTEDGFTLTTEGGDRLGLE
ncbi:hypothetical protein [Hydrogenophaga sp.]|uniref:hypothetical protein n=1 Tax=Hydrogenophaga sp. TaxID=1904254 RepID=UPI00272439D3|nr:hypothetical protein [Hydrogenophaga sp.]MDO9438560.1 hypothetical protein [Hydrogenophaga sp.]